MEEQKIFSPKFLKCNEKEFESLLKQANELLGYPNELAENYCTPMIDINKDYYFLVNEEVINLVDYSLCVSFEEIKINIVI